MPISTLQMVRAGSRAPTIEANDAALAAGFHAFDADNGFRWTDGGGAVEFSVHVAMMTWCRDEVSLRKVA